MATFHHLVSGSSYITTKGVTLRFMGKPGGVGVLTIDDETQIAELRELAKSPTAQCIEVPEEAAVTETIAKAVDPALKEAVSDAAANSERQATPEVASAQDNLAKLIAASKTATR